LNAHFVVYYASLELTIYFFGMSSLEGSFVYLLCDFCASSLLDLMSDSIYNDLHRWVGEYPG
jgi:hypothetical protein